MERNYEIIAVDFDGALCFSKWPECGEPNQALINYLKKWKSDGNKLILWTCRAGEALAKAVEWCKKQNLYFQTIVYISYILSYYPKVFYPKNMSNCTDTKKDGATAPHKPQLRLNQISNITLSLHFSSSQFSPHLHFLLLNLFSFLPA